MTGSETRIDDMEPMLPAPAPQGKSRLLIPKWLAWLLGGMSLLVTIMVILLWPSVPTLSATWQPKGPLLGTANWHKSTLNVKESVKLSRRNICEQEPHWIHVGNRLFPVMEQAAQSQGIQVWMRPSWLMDHPPPMMTNTGWVGLGMPDWQGVAWESPAGLWIPLTGYRIPHALQLLLVDPETLTELERIELDPGLPPSAAGSLAGQVDRVGIADDGTSHRLGRLHPSASGYPRVPASPRPCAVCRSRWLTGGTFRCADNQNHGGTSDVVAAGALPRRLAGSASPSTAGLAPFRWARPGCPGAAAPPAVRTLAVARRWFVVTRFALS